VGNGSGIYTNQSQQTHACLLVSTLLYFVIISDLTRMKTKNSMIGVGLFCDFSGTLTDCSSN
jgi:hypothetical protein